MQHARDEGECRSIHAAQTRRPAPGRCPFPTWGYLRCPIENWANGCVLKECVQPPIHQTGVDDRDGGAPPARNSHPRTTPRPITLRICAQPGGHVREYVSQCSTHVPRLHHCLRVLHVLRVLRVAIWNTLHTTRLCEMYANNIMRNVLPCKQARLRGVFIVKYKLVILWKMGRLGP